MFELAHLLVRSVVAWNIPADKGPNWGQRSATEGGMKQREMIGKVWSNHFWMLGFSLCCSKNFKYTFGLENYNFLVDICLLMCWTFADPNLNIENGICSFYDLFFDASSSENHHIWSSWHQKLLLMTQHHFCCVSVGSFTFPLTFSRRNVMETTMHILTGFCLNQTSCAGQVVRSSTSEVKQCKKLK